MPNGFNDLTLYHKGRFRSFSMSEKEEKHVMLEF